MGTLFYYNENKLRDEISSFLETPSVFKTSIRFYKGGRRDHYYIDFDLIINDPYKCEEIAKAFSARILAISKSRSIDLMGFIEKNNGGTFGAVRLAGLIYLTNVPNVLIRLTRELEYEKVKLPLVEGKTLRERLSGMNIAIITDHISTGRELLSAIDAVEFNGGKVTDVIAYTMRTDVVDTEKFTKRGIVLHSLLSLPDDLPDNLKVIALNIDKAIAAQG
jgi:orotate phosphoribosyltransferase